MMVAPPPVLPPPDEPPRDDGVKWLALLLRQAFLVFVAGVEVRYGLKRRAPDR